MPYTVDFNTVSIVGLESSPVAAALAGLRANEARYFKNKFNHVLTVDPASNAKTAINWVHRIPRGCASVRWRCGSSRDGRRAVVPGYDDSVMADTSHQRSPSPGTAPKDDTADRRIAPRTPLGTRLMELRQRLVATGERLTRVG